MSQVDEILKRLDKDSGADVFQDDCQTHGLSNHLSLANQVGWGNAAGQQRDPRAEEAQAYADNYQITVTYRLDPTGRDDEEMREEFADELRASFHSGSLIGHISEFIEIRRDDEAVYADVIIDRCMSDDLEGALDNYPCVELEEALKLQLGGELRECAEAGRIHAPYEVKEIDLTQLSFSDVRLY